MRLIVEDANGRRSFKVRPGQVRVGSGEGARLRLHAAGLAAAHADLEIDADGAVLHPLEAATVEGRPVTGATRVAPGQEIRLGEARIVLAPEEAAAPAAGAPAGAAPPVARRRPGGRSRRAGSSRGARSRSSAVSPVQLALLTVGIAALLAFVGWKVFSAAPPDDPDFVLRSAERTIAEMGRGGDRGRIDTLLAGLPPDSELTGEQRARLQRVRDDLANVRSASDERLANVAGHRFFDGKIERYHREHLEGEVDPEKVRYFLELCAEFRERWPTHPRMEWVEAEEARLASHGTLEDPPTWDQLEWCIDNWTGGSPKRFRDAFRLIDRYFEGCEGADCDRATRLELDLKEQEDEYFEEKKGEAQAALDAGETGRAVYWLIELAVHLADEDRSEQAAAALLKIPRLDAYLRSLRDEEPHRFAQLLQHERIRAFAAENGLG